MRIEFRNVLCIVVGLIAFLWSNPSFTQDFNYVRRGSIAYLQVVQQPLLIKRLAKEADPVELSHAEFAQLKAYLISKSRPRRMKKDQFYRQDFHGSSAVSSDPAQTVVGKVVLADPINQGQLFPSLRNKEVWERLRMHYLYNAELQKSGLQTTQYQAKRELHEVVSRKTVAVRSGSEVTWFAVKDCTSIWKSANSDGEVLYRLTSGRYVLLNGESKAVPARFVTPREAVTWLAIQGHEMPTELMQLAMNWHAAGRPKNEVLCEICDR